MVVDGRIGVSGIFEVSLYNTDDVMDVHPGFEHASRGGMYDMMQDVEPFNTFTTRNVACTQGFQWAVDQLDATQPNVPPARLLAIGRDNTTPTSGDLSLGDEVERIDITAYDDNGSNIVLTTAIGPQEGNVDVGSGEALREAGIYAGGVGGETTYFMNHSLFPVEIDKDDSITVTVDVTLTYQSV